MLDHKVEFFKPCLLSRFNARLNMQNLREFAKVKIDKNNLKLANN